MKRRPHQGNLNLNKARSGLGDLRNSPWQKVVALVCMGAMLSTSVPAEAWAQLGEEAEPSAPDPLEETPAKDSGDKDAPLVLSDELSAKGHSRKLAAGENGENGEAEPKPSTPAETTEPEKNVDLSPNTAAAELGGGDRTGVTGSVISVPKGEGTVQGMEESFSAQLSTGIATFSVPFAMPKARGSAQPSLGLSYSSSGGLGEAGLGWSVGVPFIARETDRGLPGYRDQADWHPGQDRFVFNGGQELVPICTVRSGVCARALPGEQMPSWGEGWQYFRARVEGSFLRFFWSPDHRTWRVQDKSGVSMELGVPLDGSSDTQALELNPSAPSEILRWSLRRQYDTYGDANPAASGPVVPSSVVPNNVVEYRYRNDGGRNTLTDIFHTSPAATPKTSNTAEFAHHVRLVWEERPDRTHSYRSGWRIDQTLRLVRVDVTSKPFLGASTAARELVRRYHLNYDSRFHLSHLQSVQVEGRCGDTLSAHGTTEEVSTQSLGATSCPRLPPMTFDYTHVAGHLANGQPSTTGIPGFEALDERATLVQSSPGHSLDAARTALLDINADGLEDLLVTEPGKFGGKHGVWFNGTGGTRAEFTVSGIAVAGVLGADTGSISLSNSNIVPLDLNGDAVVDLLHMPRVKQYSTYAPVQTPSGWVWQGQVTETADSLDPRIDFGRDTTDIKTLDVNFDGLVDVVRSAGTEWQTFFSLGRYPGGHAQFGQATLTSEASADISTEPVKVCVPWAGLPLRLSDKEVRLADMNGDGITDVVRLMPGDIQYWPGRGNGFWGTGEREGCAAGNYAQGRHTEMGDAPHFSDINQVNLQLSDVSGDGLSDLVQIRFNEVDLWLNKNGEGFTDRITLGSTPESPAFLSRTALTDINGSGTADILWGDATRYRYVDLAGGQRPGLLTRVSNGLGKTTDIEYLASTQEMLNAAANGKPWESTMPTVVHVVKRVTEHDNLTIAGRPPASYTTEYTYRDPLYEGRQREFRGFKSAQAKRIGDDNSPTSVSESTFLLGECEDEHPNDGVALCSLENRWQDNPREALKGLPVLTETADEAGTTLSTTHHGYTLRELYLGLDGRAVRWAFEAETNTFLYDTSPFTPANPPVFTSLNSVQVERLTAALGAPETARTVLIPVPIRSTVGTRRTRSQSFVDPFGNKTQSVAHGEVALTAAAGAAPAAIDEILTAHSVPQRLSENSGWLWRTARQCSEGSRHQPATIATPDPQNPCANKTAWGHTWFEFDPVHGQQLKSYVLVQGSVQTHRAGGSAARGVPAWSAPVQVQVSQNSYDPALGFLIETRGQHHRYAQYEYDALYRQVPTKESLHTGAQGLSSGVHLSVANQILVARIDAFDRGLEVPLIVTDVHNQQTQTVYDGFGRVIKSHAPSPTVSGAFSPVPTALISYTLPDDSGSPPYSIIHTRAQDGSDPSDAGNYLESYAYIDGLGRTIVTLSEAEKADGTPYVPGDAQRFIVSAMQEWDAKSAVRRKYLEDFFTGDPKRFDFSAAPGQPYGRQRYDAFGRALQTYDLDGTVTLTSRYHAFTTDLWDAADNEPGPHYGSFASTTKDGHGRSVEAVERIHQDGALQLRRTLTQYTPSGQPEVITRRLNNDSAKDVTRWMAYDSLGRMVLNVEPNSKRNYTLNAAPNRDFNHETRTGAAFNAWRYAYNEAGDLIATGDPRGCGVDFSVDGVGRILTEKYVPCAEHHERTPDVDVAYVYDIPEALIVPGPETDQKCQGHGGGSRVGRLAKVTDRTGITDFRYDGRGRIACHLRRLAQPRPESPLGSRFNTNGIYAEIQEEQVYGRWFEYDAANRVSFASTGAFTVAANSCTAYRYDNRGELSQVEFRIPASSFVQNQHRLASCAATAGKPIVKGIKRSADGLVERIDYGDAANTQTFKDYDERRRLRTLQTLRAGLAGWPETTLPDYFAYGKQRVLQDDEYQYDSVGNPVNIYDYRLKHEWPSGARPVSRHMQYDDFYRVTQVNYQHDSGDDPWLSPFRWEEKGARPDPRSEPAVPVSAFENRVKQQSFKYDWLGNIVKTDDDEHAFFDRSLGTIAHGPGGGDRAFGPYQLRDAEQPAGDYRGKLQTRYDEAGNLIDLYVQRRGECTEPLSGSCNARYVYQYDEVGRLQAARRFQDNQGTLTLDLKPHQATLTTQVPTNHLEYAYDYSDNRVRKSAIQENRHTLYIFSTLELRNALFLDHYNEDRKVYVDAEDSEVPYIEAQGTRLARAHLLTPTPPQIESDWNETPGDDAIIQTEVCVTTHCLDQSHPPVTPNRIRVFLQLGDHLGSTAVTVDYQTSDVVERTTYQAFGGPESDYRNEAYEGFREAVGFTGKEEDTAVGLTYFGKRYYSPYLLRWMTVDPLGIHLPFDADFNLYAYVSGRALKNIDPLGLTPGEDGTGGAPSTNEGGTDSQPGATEKQLAQQDLDAQKKFKAATELAQTAEAELVAYYEANPTKARNEYDQGANAALLNSLIEQYQQALWELHEVERLLSPAQLETSVVAKRDSALSNLEGLKRSVPDTPAGTAGAEQGEKVAMVLPGPGGRGKTLGRLVGKSSLANDFVTKNTRNFSAIYKSEGEARSLARTKLGKDPVRVEPGKLRSADGRWQYRGKPEDLKGHGASDSPHIHLERLDPKTGEVLENWHLRWDE